MLDIVIRNYFHFIILPFIALLLTYLQYFYIPRKIEKALKQQRGFSAEKILLGRYCGIAFDNTNQQFAVWRNFNVAIYPLYQLERAEHLFTVRQNKHGVIEECDNRVAISMIDEVQPEITLGFRRKLDAQRVIVAFKKFIASSQNIATDERTGFDEQDHTRNEPLCLPTSGPSRDEIKQRPIHLLDEHGFEFGTPPMQESEKLRGAFNRATDVLFANFDDLAEGVFELDGSKGAHDLIKEVLYRFFAKGYLDEGFKKGTIDAYASANYGIFKKKQARKKLKTAK